MTANGYCVKREKQDVFGATFDMQIKIAKKQNKYQVKLNYR